MTPPKSPLEEWMDEYREYETYYGAPLMVFDLAKALKAELDQRIGGGE